MSKKIELFDVVIKSHSGKIVSVIGRALTADRAEKREMTGITRTNLDGYFVETLPHRAGRKAVKS